MISTRRSLLLGLGAGVVGAGVQGSPAEAAAAGLDPIDVRQYGAVGDGVHDDSPAFAAAVQAVADRSAGPAAGIASGGGALRVPAGMYALASPLDVPPGVLLIGDSSSSSQLRYTGPSTAAVVTFGWPGAISTATGMRSLTVDAGGRADVGVLLHGPQEGSTIADSLVAGARQVAVDVRSSGVVGGSNKFTVERCWLWTSGDSGLAGLRLDAESGPIGVRDTTFVGTNRTAPPAAGSAGIIATRSTLVAENLNVEHFDAFCVLDRCDVEIHTVTSFFTKHGLVTTAASTNSSVNLSNAAFDAVEDCVADAGAGVTVAYCRGYTSDSYRYAARQLQRNIWSFGAAKVYRSDDAQATLGFESDATDDLARFKLSRMTSTGWRESASIDEDGRFGTAESAWDGPHLRLGAFHLWVDAAGGLRMKRGAPASDDDGAPVGA